MSTIHQLIRLNSKLDALLRFESSPTHNDEGKDQPKTLKRLLIAGGAVAAGVGAVKGYRKLNRWADAQPEWQGLAKEWENSKEAAEKLRAKFRSKTQNPS